MLRTNLSTRPFYNERAIHAVALAIGVLVLIVTAWQIARVVQLSREKTELTASIRRDRAQADQLNRQAADIRRGLNQKELTAIAGEAKEANDLIQQRTFSWTELFNQLEATLPEDVMLVSVRPEVKDNVTQVDVELQSRTNADIGAFWDRLEKTGSFSNIDWQMFTGTEEGLQHMTMKAVYRAPSARTAQPRPASTATPAGKGGRP